MLQVLVLTALCTFVVSQLGMPVVKVSTWGCDKSIQAQEFTFDGTFRAINIPNRCLDWQNNELLVAKCSGAPTQAYLYDDTTKAIRNPGLNLCLAPTAKTTQKEEYGFRATLLPCDGSKAQQWTLKSNTIESLFLTGICIDYASTWQCDDPNSIIAKYPMCDEKLSFEQRAKDLVSRMTLQEKYAQLLFDAPTIPRLGVKYYKYWGDSLHGILSLDDITTMYPQCIGQGAGFNQSMWYAIGNTLSVEARGLWNTNIGSLHFWDPNINILRDPRWGRGQETPGEDPLLTSAYIVNIFQGMQGNGKYLKTVPTCKHFAAYSIESWNGVTRFTFDAVIDERDQAETYFPAFKACIQQGKSRLVMCSYNSVNGIPACANSYLLQQKLRDEWGFTGFVVSDCQAVEFVYTEHHYTTTPYNASAVCLKAGTDQNCGRFYENLPEAAAHGLVTENDFNVALARAFATRFELGMFNLKSNPDTKYKYADINTKAAQEQALLVAQESIVLLKNLNNTLPLNQKVKSIAVIGPNADNADVMKGNYFGTPPYIVTALQGIKNAYSGKNIIYAKGCEIQGSDKSGFAAAIDAATKSDVIIFVMGTNQDIEREGLDRYTITLPGVQNDLIQAVKNAAKGKTMIVTLINGGPLDVGNLRDDNAIGGIVEGWFGGQSGGTAIADVIFGNYNPAGVLPVTFYANNYTDQIKMTDMNVRPFPGRTYRYLQVPAVYKFGYGLSYTKFEISVDSQQVKMFRSSVNKVRVTVRNIGSRDGDFVLLAYAKHQDDDFANEQGALAAFSRTHVKARDKVVVDLQFTDQSFERFKNGKMTALASDFVITVTGTQNSNQVSFVASVI
jgi:beta-glucosidase-like glycosyl hydrolase